MDVTKREPPRRRPTRISLREYLGLMTIVMLAVGLALNSYRLQDLRQEIKVLRIETGYLAKTAPDQIAAAHAAGDPLAERVVSIAAEVLGSSLANAVTLLSIDTIVLGGGMIESLGDAFVDQIRTGFEADVFPPQAASWCRIVPTMLRSDAGLVGAAMIAAEDSRSR